MSNVSNIYGFNGYNRLFPPLEITVNPTPPVPTNYVTTDTTQAITGSKTFTNLTFFTNDVDITGDTNILGHLLLQDIHLGTNQLLLHTTDTVSYIDANQDLNIVTGGTVSIYAPTKITLGATSYIEILSGATPTSIGPVPALNDNSTKIATTQWVQSIITGGSGNYVTIASTQTITGSKTFSNLTFFTNTVDVTGNTNILGQLLLRDTQLTSNQMLLHTDGITSFIDADQDIAILSGGTVTVYASLLHANGAFSTSGNIRMDGPNTTIYSNYPGGVLLIQGPVSTTNGVVITTNGGGSGSAFVVAPTGVTTAKVTMNCPALVNGTMDVYSTLSVGLIPNIGVGIKMMTNVPGGNYNPSTQLADNIIFAEDSNSGGVLNLTTHSSNYTGVRITPSSVTLSNAIGDSPVSYLQISNGGTPTSHGPVPDPTDNSTKIATTAWVQSIAAVTGNYVTLNTVQSITAQKDMNAVTVKNGLTIQQGNNPSNSTITQTSTASVFTNNTLGGNTDFFLYNNAGILGQPLALYADQVTMRGNIGFAASQTLYTGEVHNYNTMPASNDASTLVPSTAWVQSATKLSMPTGSITMYGGNSLPAGYLWCNGQSYDYTNPVYNPLYLVLGVMYLPMQQPVGTYFAVPDMRGVYPAMPGQNVTASFQDSGLAGATLIGPSGLGIFQHQSIPMIQHEHNTYYPGSTNTATSPGSVSYYKSGSPSLNQTSSLPIQVTAPNGFTNIGSNVTPVSIGINYIIKY